MTLSLIVSAVQEQQPSHVIIFIVGLFVLKKTLNMQKQVRKDWNRHNDNNFYYKKDLQNKL